MAESNFGFTSGANYDKTTISSRILPVMIIDASSLKVG